MDHFRVTLAGCRMHTYAVNFKVFEHTIRTIVNHNGILNTASWTTASDDFRRRPKRVARCCETRAESFKSTLGNKAEP